MCALFIGERDISLFRHISKEVIDDIVSTEIDFYKLILADTISNVYGEAPQEKKAYYQALRLACRIDKEDIVNTTDEMGVDTDQAVRFIFLRDGHLDTLNLIPEVGDIIDWDASYFEIDNVNIRQYLSGKNDLAGNKSVGSAFGANWSYVCSTHMTRRDKLGLEQTRFGQ